MSRIFVIKELPSNNNNHTPLFVTYFNPDSRLKYQTSKLCNTTGVKEYGTEEEANAVIERMAQYFDCPASDWKPTELFHEHNYAIKRY